MDTAAVQRCFNDLFLPSHKTVLRGGYDEPFYRAPRPGEPAQIRFKEDFVASALHEVAHWCIAGARRRALDDFGYWYLPTRTGADQRRFEAAERAPQALEWVLSVAAGLPFRVSVDSFDEPACYRMAHGKQVQAAVFNRIEMGLPPRAAQFAESLAEGSGCHDFLDPVHYQELRR